MAPSAFDSAEAEWQNQLSAMRTALAELKLPPKPNVDEVPYGSDIEFDEESDPTSGNSGDDVWDFISDSEDGLYDFDDEPDQSVNLSYGSEWLGAKCIEIASKRQGLSSDELCEQITALLISDSNEEELQSTLTDIVGFDDFDFIIELISHRKSIITDRSSVPKAIQASARKLQSKQEREAALRQQDYEHKNAALAPKVDRDGENYPHVYKTFAAGNTLDAKGRKFGVPLGTERKEHQVSTRRLTLTLLTFLLSDTKNTLFPPARLALLVAVESSSILPRWTDFADRLSKATKVSTECKVSFIQWHTIQAKIC